MLVARRMRRSVPTLGPDDTLERAADLFARHDVRHAPVVEEPEKALVGMLTDRDLHSVPGNAWHQAIVGEKTHGSPANARVRDVMTTAIVTVTPDTTIEEAALLLVDNRIGCLPVVDDEGALLGTLTTTDLLEVFIEVMGIGVPSTRIELLAGEGTGMLSRVVEMIHEAGGNVLSVVSVRDSESGARVLHVRLEDGELEPILSALENAGVEVLSVDEHDPV